MKKVLFIAVIAISLVACNKNQKAVKTLDGVWEVTAISYTEDGVTESGLPEGYVMTIDFDGCKLKKDEFCTMISTTTYDSDTEVETMVYRVNGDGTKLETKESINSTYLNVIEIVELDKENIKLSQTEDGETMAITAKKK